MLKEKIIQTAVAFYSRYGIKSVSMNQIANAMSISKRTIYENFENKEELLIGCLEFGTEKLRETVEETEKQSKSAIETFTAICTSVFRYTGSFCPSFYKDIVRYPDAANKLDEYKDFFKEECRYYFSKGVEEGCFLPDQNYEFITSLFVDQLHQMKLEHQTSMVHTLLRGICTEQGLEELKKYIPRVSQKINQTANTL